MKYVKPLLLAFTLFTSTPFLWSQSSAKVDPPPPNVLPNQGSVEQGTYKNPSIGIELTPADNLRFGSPEIKGTPGKVPLLIAVSAMEAEPFAGLLSPRTVMIFDADALAYYPADQRNVARYANKVIRANEADGYQTVHPARPAQISGISVARVDFVKGQVRESVLITIHNGYAFVFIFAGSDFEVIDKSIASTKVKLAR